MDLGYWLPLFFAGAMGLALLIYVILDGYDLGIGMLLPFASDDEKDVMVAAIGPFWDANETWIVLGVGILLIAFPQAHSIVLTSLYLPVTLMLMGLILRGVAFDFRAQGKVEPSVCLRLAGRVPVSGLDARCLCHRAYRRCHQYALCRADRTGPAGPVHHARRRLVTDQDRRRAVQ